jgi:hypothetical protein
MRPCPYGWSSSAGLAASVRPSSTKPEAKTSLADSKPSATTDVEWPLIPAMSFTTASAPLTNMLAAATRCPVFMQCPGQLRANRVDLFGVDAKVGEHRLHLLHIEFAVAGQA